MGPPEFLLTTMRSWWFIGAVFAAAVIYGIVSAEWSKYRARRTMSRGASE